MEKCSHGKDAEIVDYQVELRFIEEWLENPMPIKSHDVVVKHEKNVWTMEVSSEAVQASREQKNEESYALFNVLTVCVSASFGFNFRAARAGVLKLPCSINKKNKFKIKFTMNPTHKWFKVLYHWKMK